MQSKQILSHIPELLNAQELASYLNSRLCHDLISPISAINNVIELCSDTEFDKDLYKLLNLAAQSASHKLQFARIAFGAYGNPSANIDIEELKKIVNNFVVSDKISLIWKEKYNNLSKIKAKLLLNLLLIAKDCAQNEGSVLIDLETDGFTIHVSSAHLRSPEILVNMAQNKIPKEEINAHNIQIYYSLLLAKEANSPIIVEQDEQNLYFKG